MNRELPFVSPISTRLLDQAGGLRQGLADFGHSVPAMREGMVSRTAGSHFFDVSKSGPLWYLSRSPQP